ncbi:hypothetical protein FQN54_005971 [Arachnomyces sp. PD_36]|nr:hypothetical protein FQN54_005971 [Arachnomyces sp. PD_36]
MVATPDTSPEPAGPVRENDGDQSDSSRTTGTLTGHTAVFRIRDSPPQPSSSGSLTTVDRSRAVYHPRKPHRKSRTGCPNCKKRRVKCDETRPSCKKCQAYGISCDYSTVQVKSKSREYEPENLDDVELIERIDDFNTPDPRMHWMAMKAVASRVDQLLRVNVEHDEMFSNVPKMSGSDTIRALDHFTRSTHYSLGPPTGGRLMRGGVMELAMTTPYLMHIILATGTAHLRLTTPENNSYKLSESYHWQQCLLLYKKELKSGISAKNMDGLISTCILLSALMFATEDTDPKESWVFSSDPQALNWLAIQSGLRGLLEATGVGLHCQSMWWPVFMESRDEKGTFDDHRPGPVDINPGFVELCEIGPTTTEHTNPYHWPLRMLSPMMALQPGDGSIPKIITFMGRLLPDFMALLRKKDPRALLILSYWLALLCNTSHIWVASRGLKECRAICMYLEDSEDPRIVKLLELPANACGYLLRHLKEEALFEKNMDLLGFF